MLKIGRKTLLMFCLLWDWKDSPCCEEYPSSLVEKKRGVRERWVTSKNMNIYDITYILFSCLISPVQVWVINQKIYDLLTLLKHVAICLINILWVKREQLCISGEVGHLRCGPRRQTNWKVNRETCAQYSNFWKKAFFCHRSHLDANFKRKKRYKCIWTWMQSFLGKLDRCSLVVWVLNAGNYDH